MLPTRQWSADRLSKARAQGQEGYRGEAHRQGWDRDELQDGGQYENGRADEAAATSEKASRVAWTRAMSTTGSRGQFTLLAWTRLTTMVMCTTGRRVNFEPIAENLRSML